MVKFLNKKFFIAFFIFGGFFSLILSFFSGSKPPLILLKVFLSALFFGSLGLCIDLFLIKSLGEEEYEKIFSSEKEIKSDASKGIDIVDNITDEEKAHYEDIIKKDIEKESIEENKPDKKFDFFEKDMGKISDDNEPEPLSKPSTKEEIYKPFEETVEKELLPEKTKNSSNESEVSFKVKNRQINTSPEVVAKAIRTILKKDEG